MKDYQFYQKYANLPLSERFHIINFGELGLMSADLLYKEIKEIDDKIRPDIIRKEKLIREFEKYLENIKKLK